MAKLTLKSEQQIVGSMAAKVLARTGMNDLNPASIFLTLLQAAASEDFAQYYQMLQIIRNYNLDTTTGSDLDNRAFEYGLTRKGLIAASGRITILREAGYSKISSTFYTGFRSRISGDLEIFLNNAEDFPTSGAQRTLIIGRGTPNEEEVTYTPGGSNPDDNINYFKITLDVPLTNDHSLEETVILKQGVDTFIPAGTIVRVPQTGRTAEINFATTIAVTILAGEESVSDVNVLCSTPGTIGNVSIGAVTGTTAFPRPPFVGARAQNESPFSNGQDRETDTSLRNRIRAFIQALSQSTAAGISYAINGLVDSETAKRVVSSNIILPDNVGLPVKIYLDDGNGFEPSFGDQGQETIIEDAQGGEKRVQLDFFPLVKAQLETLVAEPYDMSTNGLTLILGIGNESETITFFTNQFAIPEAATAEEINRVINDGSLLAESRTSQVGTQVVLNALADANEEIQILGGTANSVLNFPTDKIQTFYLYKNDELLSKDGDTAFIDSDVESFDFSGADQILSVTVDGKTANIQTVTIEESDFASPSAAATATAAQVAVIINEQLAGATASAVAGKVRITSNTELSASSKIKINASAAATTLGFSTTEVVGRNKDYTLNAELGIIELEEALEANDVLTAGTRNTRAYLTAENPQNYTFAGGETLVISIDGGSNQTVTFTAATNLTATAVAALINAQLNGGTAVTRIVGVNTYLEIRTNSYDPTEGSIEIQGSSTSNLIFGFDLDVEVESILPHAVYAVSADGGPYSFVENDSLVTIIDNDPATKTYVVTMHYPGIVTSGTSTTLFAASGLTSIFETNNILTDFWVVFKSGNNTLSGDITKVENPTGNTFRYYFDSPAPANFDDFGVGDQVTFETMDNAGNDGNYLITNVVGSGSAYPAVINRTVSNPSALTPSSGDRYLISANAGTAVHANTVISRTLTTPTGLTPALNDRYIVAAGANDEALDEVKGRYADSAHVSVLEVHGYRYIVNGTGLNDWAGHDNEIAQYNGVGTPGWIFITPVDEDVVYSVADSTYYQFDSGTGTWIQNSWGSKAGKIATYNGSIWIFTTSTDKEVRTVTAEADLYQYDLSANTWTQNTWGGKGNKIAQWNGSAWVYTTPSANDTVDVTAESLTYQYSGSAWAAFVYWIEVTNIAGVVESATASGSALIGQRRRISTYNATSGAIVLAAAARATPTVTETFVVLPGTRDNIVDFFNNVKITALSTKAYVELANGAAQVQISSHLEGSAGYVQITGGKANSELQFSNSLSRGLRAYSYYTGLVKLVHKTIYGDEQDLESFPGVGAAGIKFQVRAPTVQEASFVLEIGLQEGRSLSNVENDVKTQVIAYVKSRGVGEEVILANIIDRVIAIPGIRDVRVITPTENILPAKNELIRTKASLISLNVVS